MNANAYIIIIIPNAQIAAARAYADTLFGESGQEGSFSVPLSASGSFPATHWGAQTLANDEIRGRLSGLPAGSMWWSYELDGHLINSSEASPPVTLSFQACLSAKGLMCVERTDI